jgi:hypothetical protein
MTASSSTSTLCPILIGRTLHLEVLSQIIEEADGRNTHYEYPRQIELPLAGGDCGLGHKQRSGVVN